MQDVVISIAVVHCDYYVKHCKCYDCNKKLLSVAMFVVYSCSFNSIINNVNICVLVFGFIFKTSVINQELLVKFFQMAQSYPFSNIIKVLFSCSTISSTPRWQAIELTSLKLRNNTEYCSTATHYPLSKKISTFISNMIKAFLVEQGQ